MDKKDYIQQFLNEMKGHYGDIPKFIHTTKGNGVNYSGPTFSDDEIVAMIDSVMFGTWISAGEKTREFERMFSMMFRHGDSVMVNSGSSANLVMIAALKEYFGWKDEDEIILSVVGFPTTLSPLVVNGLKPVFVDIEFDTLNFDLSQVRDKITDRTRGIFISPVLGNPPDMGALVEIAKRHGLHLILDNCDSLGSMWNDMYLSEYCVASSCSFYPAHHITTGEGGMVSSDNKDIINIARSISHWGRACTCVGVDNLLTDGSCKRRFAKWLPDQDIIIDHKYVFDYIGYNLKPLDMQGAIGIEQLKKFSCISAKRKTGKALIDSMFNVFIPEVKTINEAHEADTCWFGVPVVCPGKDYKVKLVSFLERNNIQTRNYFAGNILLHGGYRHLGDWEDYPEANKVLERVFFLGCSPNYTKETFSYIEEILEEWGQRY